MRSSVYSSKKKDPDTSLALHTTCNVVRAFPMVFYGLEHTTLRKVVDKLLEVCHTAVALRDTA